MKSRKYKICYLATIPDVLFSFMKGHINAVSQQMDVTVLSAGLRAELLKELDACFIEIDVRRKISLIPDIKVLLKLIRLFRKERFDIVHTIMPKTGLLGMMAAWFSGVPVRVHTFTGQIWVNKKGYQRFFFKSIDCLIVFFASHILVDSPSQLDFLEREGVLKKRQGLVIGNGSICGVDILKFHPNLLSSKQIKAELGMTQTQILILYLGRLNKDKGIFDLIVAFRHIFLVNSDVFLLMVGSEDDVPYSDIEKIAGSASVNLRRLPFTAFPEKYMAAADIFALASYREGFGQVIIEAAACSVPTIASRIYGVTDAVEDGSTGLLFEMANVGELTMHLQTLIDNPDMRRRMGESARARVVDKFNSQEVIRQQLAFYSEVLTHA